MCVSMVIRVYELNRQLPIHGLYTYMRSYLASHTLDPPSGIVYM